MKFTFSRLWLMAGLSCIIGVACSKKNSGRGGGGNRPAPAETPPAEETPEDPVGKPDVTKTSTDTVGETVPPIEADTVAEIDTTQGAALKHLIFNASDVTEGSRWKSEFLLIVRAVNDSCIRMKVRPTAGISAEVPDSVLNDDNTEGDPCSGEKEFDDDQEEKDDNKDTENTAGNEKADEKETTSLLDWGKSRFALAPTTVALCSQRLFRMPTQKPKYVGDPAGLSPVSSKTGRLVAIGAQGKMQVWMDEEYGDLCNEGTVGTPSDMPIRGVPFTIVSTLKDRLLVAHIQNLVDDSERSLDILTDAFGEVSDIDQNGKVDIFMSPDTNRLYLAEVDSRNPDKLLAQPINKPEDLAYYNSVSNPTSNEGEILYLWAPDPGSIFNHQNYATSNSVASNYAKGYAGAQIMSLISHNQRLLINKVGPEKEWLGDALAYLASAYVAGNDYSFHSLAHYMAMRPQEISLTERLNDERIFEKITGKALWAQRGFRAAFGWYLHTRLCGNTSVEPCGKIKDLLTSKLDGEKNLEALLGEPLSITLEHFGASYGVSLADDPAAVLALWKKTPPKDRLEPMLLAGLTEVNPSTPNQTVELSYDGASHTTGNDRTVASALAAAESLLFQPVFPDNDMEITLEKNTVTYILLSGLISKSTDMTAYLGPNLNITIVPMGERSSNRRIHLEKLSEVAATDQRPINLTDTKEADKLNYETPAHPGVDYTISATREIWVAGSIENTTTVVNESSAVVPDTDAYVLRVDPCADASDETACRSSGTKKVLIQAIVRDFRKELHPGLVVTTNNRQYFRGQQTWRLGVDTDGTLEDVSEGQEPIVVLFCQSEAIVSGDISAAGNPENCANGGVSKAAFNTSICGPLADYGACQGNNPKEAIAFEHYTFLNYSNTGPLYDNFFYSGPDGFPWFNNDRITWNNRETFPGRNFNKLEFDRQFLRFSYKTELKAKQKRFLAAWGGSDDPTHDLYKATTVIQEELLGKLASLKRGIDNRAAYTVPLSEEHPVLALCGELGMPDPSICADPYSNQSAIENAITTWRDENDVGALCSFDPGEDPSLIDCDAYILTKPGVVTNGGGAPTGIWIEPYRVTSYYTDNLSDERNPSTFYRHLNLIDDNSWCAGEDVPKINLLPIDGGDARCYLDEDAVTSDASDLREQLNVRADRIGYSSCMSAGTIGEDWDICIDGQSYANEADPKKQYLSRVGVWKSAVDRNRERFMPITSRHGEVMGINWRIHFLHVTVPTAAATDLNVIIGGIDESQGKYLIRARVADFDHSY